MARNCARERWGEGGFCLEQPDDKDHEDEALSLCDLPVKLIKEDNPHFLYEKPKAVESAGDDDEFDFDSLGGFGYSTAQPPPKMCLADEVIFQGQLLPVRFSVSSDNSSAGLYRRHGSRSESMTQGSVGKFRGINSSGSSSSRSQCSSSSITNSITSTSAARNSRPRVPNLFHSHPSPKPQIKVSPTTFRQASTGGARSQKSSTWDFFRLGVVKAPGMELQDLKHRSSTRRNTVSCNDSGRAFVANNGSGSNSNSSSGNKEKEITRPRARISIEKKSGILSGVGCKCSVETVTPRTIVVKSGNGKGSNIPAQAMAIREKAMRELRMKKLQKEKEQQEKLALSRHRTFEWLKGLSHATFPCEA